MRITASVAAALLAATLSAAVSAQITLVNNATGGPASSTTVGNFHRIESATPANIRIGGGSCERSGAAANAGYLPTSVVLDSTTNGGCSGAATGFTIQFWLKQTTASAAIFGYLFGDANWVGAIGAFRVFQNGAAGVGNLLVRGPFSTALATVGAPLQAANGGWVHFALVFDSSGSGSLTWYVNGVMNATTQSTISPVTVPRGTNFTCMGYNGSSSAGVPAVGQMPAYYDDVRIYNWARTVQDIAADYQTGAGGTGPSGCPNTPDDGYYDCEAPLNPHVAGIALGGEPTGDFVRLFTVGERLEWAVTSPGAGPYAGTAIINIYNGAGGKPRTDAYSQPTALPGGNATTTLPVFGLVAGFDMRTCISVPGGIGIAFPDALNIGQGLVDPCGGGSIVVPYSYPPQPANAAFPYPANFLNLVDGDKIEIQWLAQDSSYAPLPIAVSNRCTFEYVTPTKQGPAVHVEARGVNTIQNTGFFEIWNTGTVAITQVEIDLTGTTASGWDPAGLLNSGGTLATGTSFRFLTDAICDLTPATNPRYALFNGIAGLRLMFTPPPAPAGGFQGPTNHFIFDCDTSTTGSGAAYVGAQVKVFFADNTMLMGALAIDPGDPQGAQIDL